MSATTLLERRLMSVSDFRCDARPGDTPFAEQHGSHSISYVRKGSFGCRCRGRAFELVAGSILIGHPGDEFICSHDHVCGDECLSFFLGPELVQTIGDQTDVWQIGAAPPGREWALRLPHLLPSIPNLLPYSISGDKLIIKQTAHDEWM